jgi:hypothetical protein
MYAQTLWSQYRSDGMGGFISTDYIVFKSCCSAYDLSRDEEDLLWLKVKVLDNIRRLEAQAERAAAQSASNPSASSKYSR